MTKEETKTKGENMANEETKTKGENMTKEETKASSRKGLSGEEKVRLEREIRRYVKRAGGFRKGLSKKDIAQAEELLKRIGREAPQWDSSIEIPGMDAPTVANLRFDEDLNQMVEK